MRVLHLLQHRRHTRGFSMIEMLVALVILSLGLLGVAALQSRGQQYTHEAYLLTQITILGYQIMDNIRENGDFARNDVLDNTASNGYGYVTATRPDADVDCVENACTNAELRSFHLQEWYDALASTLPGGTATITGEKGAGVVTYKINITWALRESLRGEDDEETKTEQWEMQL